MKPGDLAVEHARMVTLRDDHAVWVRAFRLNRAAGQDTEAAAKGADEAVSYAASSKLKGPVTP